MGVPRLSDPPDFVGLFEVFDSIVEGGLVDAHFNRGVVGVYFGDFDDYFQPSEFPEAAGSFL